MSAEATPEDKELGLVGKVELRIALAETPDKLQSLLATYLCPLLLKLESPHKSVKDKIEAPMGTEDADPTSPLSLPVADLLVQFKKTSSPTVRQFDLLYVEHGLKQLSASRRLELVPVILQGLSANFEESPRNTALLFNIFLRLLQDYPLPSRGTQDDRELREKWKLDVNPEDARFLTEWIGNLMLLHDSSTRGLSPGLSLADAEFLNLYGRDSTWDVDSGGLSLYNTKMQAVKLLWTAAFLPSEKFFPALLASGSTTSRVSEIGEEVLKTNMDGVSMEDHAIVSKLYSYLLDSSGNSTRPAAHPILKCRILRLLSKSKEATKSADEIMALSNQELRRGRILPSTSNQHDRGLEASKLLKETFSFILWVAREAAPETMNEIGLRVIQDIRSYIENQGWPEMNEGLLKNMSLETTSRQLAYESIGLLARACAGSVLVEPSLELLRWLFSSLVGDVASTETSLSIESALAIIMSEFGSHEDDGLTKALTELLLHYMELELEDVDSTGTKVKRSPRFVALRFANRSFPFHHLPARWINLLGLSKGTDERQEILEEGTRGLDPYWFEFINPRKGIDPAPSTKEADIKDHCQLPALEDASQYFFGSEEKLKLLRHASVKAVLFCRNTLFHGALSARSLAPIFSQDWERSLEILAAQNEQAREAIAYHIQEIHSQNSTTLLLLLRSAFETFLDNNVPGSSDTGTALRSILSLSSAQVRELLASRISEIVPRTFSSNSTVRTDASQIFAMIASVDGVDPVKRTEHVEGFLKIMRGWQKAIGGEVHHVCGAMLSMANLLCQLVAVPEILSRFDSARKETVNLILSVLFASRDEDLLQTSLLGLDQLFIYGILTDKNLPEDHTPNKISEKLYELAKSGKEVAIAALGHFAMQCPEDMSEGSTTKDIFEKLQGLTQTDFKQFEVYFSIGSAFSCLTSGWQSRSLTKYRDVQLSELSSAPRKDLLTQVLSKMLENSSQPKPSLRHASVAELLTLCQDCSDQPEIQSHLRSIHLAFRNCLSDKNSTIQEIASRGLALIYEIGEKDIKDELVKDLVRSFTSNKSNLAGTVSNDTELFDAGALPTGDGSVTTYKNIVDLATEVGDPSLVYKFMAMASNSALWSSRAALGHFGLNKVLADARESGLLAQNPKLYSALYRYRFDPNTNVRHAMREIWNSLVKNDTEDVLNKYFEQILDDLLTNITGKEWRIRQACCDAVSDLTRTMQLSRYEHRTADIWSSALKAVDDIKGSVREAALNLVLSLSKILKRNLEHGSSPVNSKVLEQLVPLLCGPRGLDSSASDVRPLALKAIVDIILGGEKKALQPYLGSLVAEHLLPLFTSMEPDVINYAYMKPSSFNITTAQIDNTRLSSVKLSPVMEAIERCLDMLDKTSMDDLAKRLGDNVKAMIGVPSKIGVCRVIVTLSTKHNVLFRPLADRFLKLLYKLVLDKNETVSTSAAAACGYLVRISSDQSVLEHIQRCKNLYFQAAEEKARFASADLTCATIKYATDRTQSYAAELFPFIFMGMHDTDEATATEFKSAWEEMVGGSRTVNLYLQEITELTAAHIDSAQWAFKHASALAVADAIQLLGSKISDKDARILWPTLDKALSAKTWDGKEKVLQGFAHYVEHAQLSREDVTIRDRCKVIAIREAKRNNAGIYRQQAVKVLGQLVATRKDTDWFESVWAAVLPIVESLTEDADAMDVDDDAADRRTRLLIREETLSSCITTLFGSIDPQTRHGSGLDDSLEQATRTSRQVSQHGTLVQNSLFEAQRNLMQRLASATEAEVPDTVLVGMLATLDVKGEGVEATRLKSAEVVEAMAKVVKPAGEARARLLGTVTEWIGLERSRSVNEVLQRTKQSLSG